jgi:hypothetical protein
MKHKNNEEYFKMSMGGLSLTFLIYISVSIVSISMFGIFVSSSVLNNIGFEYSENCGPLGANNLPVEC